MTVKLKCWQLHLSVLKVNLNKLSTLNVYIHLVTLISIKCVAETFTAAIVISCLFQEGYFAFSLVYCISWIDVRWNGINGDFALNNVQGSSPKIGGVKRAMSPTLLTQWRCEHPQTGLKLKSFHLNPSIILSFPTCWSTEPKQWKKMCWSHSQSSSDLMATGFRLDCLLHPCLPLLHWDRYSAW